MSHNHVLITKNNLDEFLTDLAKEYRKLSGKYAKAEIILVGGAAIIAKYNFRLTTSDTDAIVNSPLSMKEIINRVATRKNLPYKWLNSDFIKTKSFSPKLVQFSQYYRTFSNVLDVRIVSGEYLIAMKLCSGRNYKKDLSDVLGILIEHRKIDKPISIEDIDKAVKDLYGGWEIIPDKSISFIYEMIDRKDLDNMYENVKQSEEDVRIKLLQFEQDYPNVLNQENVDYVIDNIKKEEINRQSNRKKKKGKDEISK